MSSDRFTEQARELVAQMTLEERASMLRYDAPAIPRLGIPAYNWWNAVSYTHLQLVGRLDVHANSSKYLSKIKCILRSQGRKDAVRGTTLIDPARTRSPLDAGNGGGRRAISCAKHGLSPAGEGRSPRPSTTSHPTGGSLRTARRTRSPYAFDMWVIIASEAKKVNRNTAKSTLCVQRSIQKPAANTTVRGGFLHRFPSVE